MPWLGTFVPMPGLLTGFVGIKYKVRDFDAANTLVDVTWHVTDAPSGGSVTIRAHDQADGGGNYVEAVILDGTTYITKTESLTTGAGLWQEITAESGSAMNLSGEYTMSSASGITDYFTTLAIVKLNAKIADVNADRDTVLTAMMAGVTRMMQDYMGRDIVQGTATAEKLDGWYQDSVFTKHYPITNFTALTENDTALVEDTDYESLEGDLESGRIVRISGGNPLAWTAGRRNIAITYDHGYIAVPDSLVTACTALVVAKFNETVQSGKSWGGLLSKGVNPNDAVTYDKAIWERETVPAMQRFKRRDR